ncbi:ankyrin repeat-containing domain protein [Lipomyces arxii]|uniref:ankyrin repeat-containing domain protein n=1 Tax=Lipomyces arxii TaxID=56418 RepID=UPI0034CF2FF7
MAAPNLWIAASDNNLTVVRSLIDSKVHTANDKDHYGYTPIHAAASYSHLNLLRYLASAGGDVNITDQDGETPLFVVETVDAAKVLVEELHADWQHKNVEGLTAREKFEAEAEEDDEPLEEVVAYLKSLEGESDIVKELEEKIKEALPDGTNIQMKVADVDNSDDALFTERRKKIEQMLKDGGSESDIRNLVEEAVRLQLSEGNLETERSDVTRKRVELENNFDE